MHKPDLSISEFVSAEFKKRHIKQEFISGVTPIPVTGKVFGPEELEAAVSASLEFWLTSGPYTLEFESKFAKQI